MDYLMLFALSAIVGILYNAILPKLSANATVAQYTNSYAGKAALTTVAVFAALVGASFLMGVVSKSAKNKALDAV